MKNLYGIDIKLTKEREELMEGGWEAKRMESMIANIKYGDIIFDVGAEQGDMTAMLSKKAGDKSTVIFEPSPMMWPHIKANFERNNIKPLDCYVEFVSDKTEEKPEGLNYDDKIRDGYPECAYDKLDNTRGFRYLHEEAKATKQITIDDYCKRTGNYPDIVTIDVEGSEYNVLEGMSKTIDKVMPIIYLSLHDNFLYLNYKKFPQDIFKFFDARNYKYKLLGFDHEFHYVFYKKSLKVISEII